ncbi:MAG: sigma-54-dependent transcriptional regulator [Rickettsiales bacterium]
MTHTILIGEDDPLQRKMISFLLTKKLDYSVREAKDGREVLDIVEASSVGDISAVLLDINMPTMDGYEALQRLRKTRPDIPVIMLTAHDDTSVAVKCIKAGASDFIIKPPEPSHLDIALKNAIRMSALSRELTRLKRDREGALGFEDLIGCNTGLAEAVGYGRKAATSDVAVLIQGEISTGKELMARAIHGESRRVGAPFIAINCSTIPEHALEQVLFGYEKGAGANAALRSIGKLREAERGTVFLDDIHLLTPDAQVKLLRVLQDKEVEPIGAAKPVKVNLRTITATHIDLKQAVESGTFREDLYFRLHVLGIAMPALRERPQDILVLVDHFLQRLCTLDGLPLKLLTADAKHYLTDYRWPGNVRELEGLMHRALVLSGDAPIDRALLMQIHDADIAEGKLPLALDAAIALRQANGMFKTMDAIETEAMQLALAHYHQNITRAAEALGIAKSTFYRKMKLAVG